MTSQVESGLGDPWLGYPPCLQELEEMRVHMDGGTAWGDTSGEPGGGKVLEREKEREREREKEREREGERERSTFCQ